MSSSATDPSAAGGAAAAGGGGAAVGGAELDPSSPLLGVLEPAGGPIPLRYDVTVDHIAALADNIIAFSDRYVLPSPVGDTRQCQGRWEGA